MSQRGRSIPSSPRARRRRRGFSFVEIMFAVMILGIGFILIAGVFPVALSQTQANGDETVASTIAREATHYISSLPGTSALMTADNSVHRFGPGGPQVNFNGGSVDGDAVLWNLIRGNVALPEDPRYGWVPFYLRRAAPGVAGSSTAQPSDSAQIIVIGTRVRNHSAYQMPDPANSNARNDVTPDANGRVTLMGKSVSATVSSGGPGNTADTITFTGGDTGAITPGTFVIVASDGGASATGVSAAGWILKVGNIADATKNQWNLAPGGDLKNSPNYTPGALQCWVVGQGNDPDNPSLFSGGPQDIMAYTTFVLLH